MRARITLRDVVASCWPVRAAFKHESAEHLETLGGYQVTAGATGGAEREG